jgi:hypothetical protein
MRKKAMIYLFPQYRRVDCWIFTVIPFHTAMS